MQKHLIAPLLGALLVACDAQDIPIKSSRDSGSHTNGGTGGNAGESTTGGMSGSALTTGTGGLTGAGGSNGQGGSGGSAGTPMADASSDVASAVDAPADTGGGTGGSYPDASTCAGYAVVFNGFAYGTISNRPVEDDFTLEAWIKTTDARTGMNNFFEGSGLIYADVPGKANDFGSSLINGRFAFGVGNPDTTIVSTSTVNTGQWVHVAATRKMSTGEIQVFVNGTMEASLIVAQTSSLNASVSMSLGANVNDARYFTGSMDEVRIWNVVRTQSEISTNMHKRMNGNETGLVGYYRFDQPGADTAKDLSPKMGDATLVGPDWAVSDAPICN
jgi:hypothetical protein